MYNRNCSMLYVKMPQSGYVGVMCGTSTLHSAGLLLYKFYNSHEKALELIKLGTLYQLGVTLTCGFKGSENELSGRFETESRSNANLLSTQTIAFHRNFGMQYSLYNQPMIDKSFTGKTYVFEDGEWYIYSVDFARKYSLKKLFTSRAEYEEVGKTQALYTPNWEKLQSFKSWFKYLNSLTKYEYQLATDVNVRDVIFGDSKSKTVSFLKKQHPKNRLMYYVVLDNAGVCHYALKEWVLKNIHRCSNVNASDDNIYFVKNK